MLWYVEILFDYIPEQEFLNWMNSAVYVSPLNAL